VVHIVKAHQRDLKPYSVPGATVQVSDAIVSRDRNLSAGFTEYLEASRLEWTFDYNEVFFMVEGALEIHPEGEEIIRFETGDLGFIEKDTKTVIVVPERAYLVHCTQPAWREEADAS
jgi:ethanolamine utilization protein EutQ (cupin superfamily)